MSGNSSGIFVWNLSFFLYYAIAGLIFPYFPLWLKNQGFSNQQVAHLMSIRPFLILIIPVLTGYLTTRFHFSGQKLLVILSGIYAITSLLFLWPAQFWVWFVILGFHFSFREPIKPLLETLCMENGKREDFAKARLYGSTGFVITSLFGSLLFELGKTTPYYIAYVISQFLVFLILRKYFSQKNSYSKTTKSHESTPDTHPFHLNFTQILFLIFIFIRSVAHVPFGVYFSIFIETEIGVSSGWIGLSWLVAVIFEMIMMREYHRFFGKWKTEHVIVFSLFFSFVRFSLVAFTTQFWQILFLQTLHSLTFAAFYLACMEKIRELFPGRQRMIGLNLNTSMQMGMGMLIGAQICAQIEPFIGLRNLYFYFSMIPLSLVILFIFYSLFYTCFHKRS